MTDTSLRKFSFRGTAGTSGISATTGTVVTYNLSPTTVGASYPIQASTMESLRKPVGKNIESAVYAHIQAVRALGRTTINTVEISKALGLPLAAVDSTLELLKKKGVKVAA